MSSNSYLQSYGVVEEHRNRIVKRIVWSCIVVLIISLAAYLFFHNFPERQKAKAFLSEINTRNYQAAYTMWGCTDKTPCPNYDFQRFMNDWGPKSSSGPWQVASTDSCASFLTINVQAAGSELESLAVQRSDHSLGFAPAPECQERKWHWKLFLQRMFGRAPAPPTPGTR